MPYALRLEGKIPAKSNGYRAVTRKLRGGGTRTFFIKSDEVIAFEQYVATTLQNARVLNHWPEILFPAQETIQVTLVWHVGNMRPRDLDNIWKALLDGLTIGGMCANDRQMTSQIARLRFDAPTENEEWLEILIERDPWEPDSRWVNHHTKPTPKARSPKKPRATASSPAKGATDLSDPAITSKLSGIAHQTISGSVADAPTSDGRLVRS